MNEPMGNVVAKLVPDDDRLNVLPRLFGRSMSSVESAVYTTMCELCADYVGGYWHFHTLSNGGFYMATATRRPVHVRVDGNGYEGSMSADAAGIVVLLFVYSRMSFSDERFGDHFHALRDFALGHAEQAAIFAATD